MPPSGWRDITFGRANLFVPADWPIVDTSVAPSSCVRFDLHAVYLGGQGPQAHCPAAAIGHTDAVQVQALDGAATPGVAWGRPSTIGGQRARIASFGSTSRTLTVAFPDLGVLVTATYLSDRTVAATIVSSVTRAASPRPVPPPLADVLPSFGPALGVTARAGVAANMKLAATASGYIGPGFDACTAPPFSGMQAWLSSAFRAVGIYIGGANRACSQANLTSSWVTSVEGLGWNLMPLYVGLQAPCASQGGMASISTSKPGTQGRQAADDAVSKAAPLGLGLGSPIYFDMEAYNSTSQACVVAVERFLSAWTKELHVKGYVSGVYGSSGSTMKELVHYYGNASYASPDDIWFANWNNQATTFGDPYIPDSLWADHQRIHQYKGGHTETHPKGGVQVNIDSSQVDGAVIGKPAEGSFVRSLSGKKYRIAGGVPFRVTDCSLLSNCRPVETLSTLKRLGRYPVDGTVISSAEHGRVYVVAGGAALRVGTCLINPRCAQPIALEQATINALGFGHLLLSPVNGTELQGTTSSDYWRLRNGCRTSITSSTSAVAVADATIASLFPLCQGTIAFDSGPRGHHHIYSIRGDGRGLTRLTSGPADDTSPAISPDGTKVAFTRTVNGNPDVFVMNIGGGGLLRLTRKRGFDGSPSWSPDGASIAFQSDRAGDQDIWSMTSTGASLVQLTGDPSSDRHPSWSPDGATIEFESNRTDQFHLWTMTSA